VIQPRARAVVCCGDPVTSMEIQQKEIPGDLAVLFYHVYTCGSFTKAADYLHKAQSSVSEGIQQLEDDVGQKLLIRGGPFLRLTAFGAEFLDHSAKPAQQALNWLNTTHGQGEGLPVNVGAPHYIVENHLVPMMAGLASGSLPVRLSVTSGTRQELEIALSTHAIDVAIMLVDEASGFGHVDLVPLQLAMFAAAQLAAHKLEDLVVGKELAHPLVCPPTDDAVARRCRQHLESLGIRCHVSHEICSTSLVPLTVVARKAIGPCVTLPSFLRQRGIRALPMPGCPGVSVTAHYCGTPNLGTREFLRVLAERARIFRSKLPPGNGA